MPSGVASPRLRRSCLPAFSAGAADRHAGQRRLAKATCRSSFAHDQKAVLSQWTDDVVPVSDRSTRPDRSSPRFCRAKTKCLDERRLDVCRRLVALNDRQHAGPDLRSGRRQTDGSVAVSYWSVCRFFSRIAGRQDHATVGRSHGCIFNGCRRQHDRSHRRRPVASGCRARS